MAIFSETIALLIKADTGGAVAPLRRLEGQATQTANAWDRAGKKIGVSGATLKGGLASLAAGLSLETIVRGLGQVATQFVNSAKAAGDLAAATGGTIENVSAMQAALVDAGVSAEKSAAMITKFATAAGTAKGADTLRALNVEMVRGQSGAVDYAATMTVAVDQIAALGDAAQRNTALVALFGRQGSAAFQDLIASGVSFADAMEAINTGRIFTAEDYRNAQEFDAALDRLNATVDQLTIGLGRGLAPAMTDAAAGLQVLGDVVDALPGDALEALGAVAIGPLASGLALIGKLFGDDAEAAADMAAATGDAATAQQALTAVIAAGATSGEAFAAAVAAAGDELAAQDANARLAAQALDVYRDSTERAYEATLKLLGLERSERSAQRAAEGAADSAGDAKANMDKALVDAKAAKTVVENIAAIKGRERKKTEQEGIVKGSTDVAEIEGIKGRAAQKKTRVIEAAGVITDAEARQIREATRQYEQSLDDIAGAWEALADAKIKALEADGKILTEAEKLDVVRKALEEGLQSPGLSAKAKDNIRADLVEIENKIKELGGVPITITGIKFAPGTTEAQVASLQRNIADAMKRRDFGLAEELRGELDSLRQPGVTDLKAALGLDPASVAATQASLANIGTNPATGRPYEAKTVAKVDKTQAQKDLDALTKARTMTVTVDLVPGTGGGGLPSTGNFGPIPPTTAPRLNFGGAQGMSFSPTIISNYPKPERTSDSIASALRTAKYVVGLS